jgi:hypothetical protein
MWKMSKKTMQRKRAGTHMWREIVLLLVLGSLDGSRSCSKLCLLLLLSLSLGLSLLEFAVEVGKRTDKPGQTRWKKQK